MGVGREEGCKNVFVELLYVLSFPRSIVRAAVCVAWQEICGHRLPFWKLSPGGGSASLSLLRCILAIVE